MKEIEIEIRDKDGNTSSIKALAIICIVRTDSGFSLIINENGELTEEWWRQFPEVLISTMESGLSARRLSIVENLDRK